MKKKITFTIILLIGTMVTFYSCKKSSSNHMVSVTDQKTLLSSGISLISGRMAFDNDSSYENYIATNNVDIDNEETSTSRIAGFNNSQDTLIEDEFLASILNEKNIVQIGSKAFKLDFDKEQVYVLRDINFENMSILENKDVNSGKLAVYSFDDDVLELESDTSESTVPAANARKHKKPKCTDKGVRRCKAKSTNVTDEQLDAQLINLDTAKITYLRTTAKSKLVYQKAGIYFSLQSKIVFRSKEATAEISLSSGKTVKARTHYTYKPKLLTYCKASADFKYQVKCKAEHIGKADNPLGCQSKIVMDDPTTKSHRIYRGSKGLTKYCVSVRYDYYTKACPDVLPSATNAVSILKIGQGYPDCVFCN